MPTRPPDSTHEAEDHQPLDAGDPKGRVESPSAAQMKGANGLPHHPEPPENPAGDQDIDTAGTDADDASPTKSMGTGIAPSRSKG